MEQILLCQFITGKGFGPSGEKWVRKEDGVRIVNNSKSSQRDSGVSQVRERIKVFCSQIKILFNSQQDLSSFESYLQSSSQLQQSLRKFDLSQYYNLRPKEREQPLISANDLTSIELIKVRYELLRSANEREENYVDTKKQLNDINDIWGQDLKNNKNDDDYSENRTKSKMVVIAQLRMVNVNQYISSQRQQQKDQQQSQKQSSHQQQIISKQVIYSGPYQKPIIRFSLTKQRNKLLNLNQSYLINSFQQSDTFQSIKLKPHILPTNQQIPIPSSTKINLISQLKMFKQSQLKIEKQKIQEELKSKQQQQNEIKRRQLQRQLQNKKLQQQKIKLHKLFQNQQRKNLLIQNTKKQLLSNKFYRNCPCCRYKHLDDWDQLKQFKQKQSRDNSNSLSKKGHRLFRLSGKKQGLKIKEKQEAIDGPQDFSSLEKNKVINWKKQRKYNVGTAKVKNVDNQREEDEKTLPKAKTSKNGLLERLINLRMSKQSERPANSKHNRSKYEILLRNMRNSKDDQKNQGGVSIQPRCQIHNKVNGDLQGVQLEKHNDNNNKNKIHAKRCYCCSKQREGPKEVFKYLRAKKYPKIEDMMNMSHSQSLYHRDNQIHHHNHFKVQQQQDHELQQQDSNEYIDERETLSEYDKEEFQLQFEHYTQHLKEEQSNYNVSLASQIQNNVITNMGSSHNYQSKDSNKQHDQEVRGEVERNGENEGGPQVRDINGKMVDQNALQDQNSKLERQNKDKEHQAIKQTNPQTSSNSNKDHNQKSSANKPLISKQKMTQIRTNNHHFIKTNSNPNQTNVQKQLSSMRLPSEKHKLSANNNKSNSSKQNNASNNAANQSELKSQSVSNRNNSHPHLTNTKIQSLTKNNLKSAQTIHNKNDTNNKIPIKKQSINNKTKQTQIQSKPQQQPANNPNTNEEQIPKQLKRESIKKINSKRSNPKTIALKKLAENKQKLNQLKNKYKLTETKTEPQQQTLSPQVAKQQQHYESNQNSTIQKQYQVEKQQNSQTNEFIGSKEQNINHKKLSIQIELKQQQQQQQDNHEIDKATSNNNTEKDGINKVDQNSIECENNKKATKQLFNSEKQSTKNIIYQSENQLMSQTQNLNKKSFKKIHQTNNDHQKTEHQQLTLLTGGPQAQENNFQVVKDKIVDNNNSKEILGNQNDESNANKLINQSSQISNKGEDEQFQREKQIKAQAKEILNQQNEPLSMQNEQKSVTQIQQNNNSEVRIDGLRDNFSKEQYGRSAIQNENIDYRSFKKDKNDGHNNQNLLNESVDSTNKNHFQSIKQLKNDSNNELAKDKYEMQQQQLHSTHSVDQQRDKHQVKSIDKDKQTKSLHYDDEHSVRQSLIKEKEQSNQREFIQQVKQKNDEKQQTDERQYTGQKDHHQKKEGVEKSDQKQSLKEIQSIKKIIKTTNQINQQQQSQVQLSQINNQDISNHVNNNRTIEKQNDNSMHQNKQKQQNNDQNSFNNSTTKIQKNETQIEKGEFKSQLSLTKIINQNQQQEQLINNSDQNQLVGDENLNDDRVGLKLKSDQLMNVSLVDNKKKQEQLEMPIQREIKQQQEISIEKQLQRQNQENNNKVLSQNEQLDLIQQNEQIKEVNNIDQQQFHLYNNQSQLNTTQNKSMIAGRQNDVITNKNNKTDYENDNQIAQCKNQTNSDQKASDNNNEIIKASDSNELINNCQEQPHQNQYNQPRQVSIVNDQVQNEKHNNIHESQKSLSQDQQNLSHQFDKTFQTHLNNKDQDQNKDKVIEQNQIKQIQITNHSSHQKEQNFSRKLQNHLNTQQNHQEIIQKDYEKIGKGQGQIIENLQIQNENQDKPIQNQNQLFENKQAQRREQNLSKNYQQSMKSNKQLTSNQIRENIISSEQTQDKEKANDQQVKLNTSNVMKSSHKDVMQNSHVLESNKCIMEDNDGVLQQQNSKIQINRQVSDSIEEKLNDRQKIEAQNKETNEEKFSEKQNQQFKHEDIKCKEEEDNNEKMKIQGQDRKQYQIQRQRQRENDQTMNIKHSKDANCEKPLIINNVREQQESVSGNHSETDKQKEQRNENENKANSKREDNNENRREDNNEDRDEKNVHKIEQKQQGELQKQVERYCETPSRKDIVQRQQQLDRNNQQRNKQKQRTDQKWTNQVKNEKENELNGIQNNCNLNSLIIKNQQQETVAQNGNDDHQKMHYEDQIREQGQKNHYHTVVQNQNSQQSQRIQQQQLKKDYKQIDQNINNEHTQEQNQSNINQQHTPSSCNRQCVVSNCDKQNVASILKLQQQSPKLKQQLQVQKDQIQQIQEQQQIQHHQQQQQQQHKSQLSMEVVKVDDHLMESEGSQSHQNNYQTLSNNQQAITYNNVSQQDPLITSNQSMQNNLTNANPGNQEIKSVLQQQNTTNQVPVQQVSQRQQQQQQVQHQYQESMNKQQQNGQTPTINNNQSEQLQNVVKQQLNQKEDATETKDIKKNQNQLFEIKKTKQIKENQDQHSINKVENHNSQQQQIRVQNDKRLLATSDKELNQNETNQQENNNNKVKQHNINEQIKQCQKEQKVNIEIQTQQIVLKSMDQINTQSMRSINTQRYLLSNRNKQITYENKHQAQSTYQQTQPYEDVYNSNHNNFNKTNDKLENQPLKQQQQSTNKHHHNDKQSSNSSQENKVLKPKVMKKMVFMQPLGAAFSRIDQSSSQHTHGSLKNIYQQQQEQYSPPLNGNLKSKNKNVPNESSSYQQQMINKNKLQQSVNTYVGSSKQVQSSIQINQQKQQQLRKQVSQTLSNINQTNSNKVKQPLQQPIKSNPQAQTQPQTTPSQQSIKNQENQTHEQNQNPLMKLQNLFLKNHPQSTKQSVVIPQSLPQSVMDKLAPVLQSSPLKQQSQQQQKVNLQSLLANLKNMGKMNNHPSILNQVIKSTQTPIQNTIIYLNDHLLQSTDKQLDVTTLRYAIKYVMKHLGDKFITQKLLAFQSKQICLFIDNQWMVFSYKDLTKFKDIESFIIDNKQLLSTTKTKQLLNTKLMKQIENLILFIVQQQHQESSYMKFDIIKWIQILTGLNFKKVRSREHQLTIDDQIKLSKRIKSFFSPKIKSIAEVQTYIQDKLVLKLDENHLGVINGMEAYKSASKRSANNQSETGKEKQSSVASLKSHAQKKQYILSYTLQSNDTLHHTELTSSSIFLTYLTPNIKYHTLTASISTINTFELYLGNCMLVASDNDFRFILYKQTAKDKYQIVKDGKGFIKYPSPKQKNVYLLIVQPLLVKNKKTINDLNQYEHDIMIKKQKPLNKNICIRYYFKELAQDRFIDRLIQCLYSGMGKNTNGGYQNDRNVYLPVQRIPPSNKERSSVKSDIKLHKILEEEI